MVSRVENGKSSDAARQADPHDGLTSKQLAVLECIRDEIAQTGRPPTYRDIAQRLGYDAVGTVQDHIRALLRKGYLQKDEGLSRGLRLSSQKGAQEIPLLGSVPAGNPIEAIQDARGSVAIPGSLRGDLFALRITGESMIEAGILDGDVVIVRKQSHAENGEIVVAMIDGEATVKYLEKKAGQVRLLPANPRFQPIEIPLHSRASDFIQGKVLGVQRFY
jgi:repressor LexA